MNYSLKWIKRSESAPVNECLHVLVIRLVESRLNHALYMSMWVSIPNQGSTKYEIYSSIEHDNVIEQQMSENDYSKLNLYKVLNCI